MAYTSKGKIVFPSLLIAFFIFFMEGMAGPVRGPIAMRQADGSVYLGWRLLGSDPVHIGFHVYRKAADGDERLTPEPIRSCTNFVDKTASQGGMLLYRIEALEAGKILDRSPEIKPLETNYIRIPLQGEYRFQKAGTGDLDGDGQLDYVVKQPDFNVDPYQNPGYWKKSEDTYKIEAYNSSGPFMWRHDMGWSIEEGIWYSPYVIYDLDQDGQAEVYCKGGEGDPREATGHVTSGAEWLFKLDGKTGRILQRIPWIEKLPEVGEYNYQNRNMLAIAIYSTCIPAGTKRPWLLEDRLYRLYVAVNTMGYNTPPQHSRPYMWR